MRPVIAVALVVLIGALDAVPAQAAGPRAAVKEAIADKLEQGSLSGAGAEQIGDRVRPSVGGSVEGTGIRRKAPPLPLTELFERFLGGSTEGTGIRRKAPPRTLVELMEGFLGGSQEGTGI